MVGDQFITIKELAEAVVARYPTELTFGEPRLGDVPSATVSAERAAGLLGWRPEVLFEEGLDEILTEAGALSGE